MQQFTVTLTMAQILLMGIVMYTIVMCIAIGKKKDNILWLLLKFVMTAAIAFVLIRYVVDIIKFENSIEKLIVAASYITFAILAFITKEIVTIRRGRKSRNKNKEISE